MKKEKQNIPGWYVFFSIMCCMALFFIGMIVGENSQNQKESASADINCLTANQACVSQLQQCNENEPFYIIGRQVMAEGPKKYCKDKGFIDSTTCEERLINLVELSFDDCIRKCPCETQVYEGISWACKYADECVDKCKVKK